ncbi:hypothetical protein [Bradyrhizobium barranii]
MLHFHQRKRADPVEMLARQIGRIVDPVTVERPVGRSKSPGYGHLKLPHLMIAVSAAEQQ